MEYPFKDLLPLDEVLAREGYYKDWTHLDPEVFYSLTQISNFIKTKGYGVDVRLLIAQLAEHFGLKTTQVVDLANLLSAEHDALKAQFDVVIRDATSGADWGGEIVLARGGKPTLQARLDDTTAQLAQTNNLKLDKSVYEENKLQTDNLISKKADQSFVDSQLSTIVSGAPKGTYTNLTALQTAYPNGAEGVFLVLETGHWYYWNSSLAEWADGGVYQSTGFGDNSVTFRELDKVSLNKYSFAEGLSKLNNQYDNIDYAKGLKINYSDSGTVSDVSGRTRLTTGALSVNSFYYNPRSFPKSDAVTYSLMIDKSKLTNKFKLYFGLIDETGVLKRTSNNDANLYLNVGFVAEWDNSGTQTVRAETVYDDGIYITVKVTVSNLVVNNWLVSPVIAITPSVIGTYIEIRQLKFVHGYDILPTYDYRGPSEPTRDLTEAVDELMKKSNIVTSFAKERVTYDSDFNKLNRIVGFNGGFSNILHNTASTSPAPTFENNDSFLNVDKMLRFNYRSGSIDNFRINTSTISADKKATWGVWIRKSDIETLGVTKFYTGINDAGDKLSSLLDANQLKTVGTSLTNTISGWTIKVEVKEELDGWIYLQGQTLITDTSRAEYTPIFGVSSASGNGKVDLVNFTFVETENDLMRGYIYPRLETDIPYTDKVLTAKVKALEAQSGSSESEFAGKRGALISDSLGAASNGYVEFLKPLLGVDYIGKFAIAGRGVADSVNGDGANKFGLVFNGTPIDYSTIDFVVIPIGTNDFKLNVPIGEMQPINSGGYDVDSFCGAFQHLIEGILSQNKKINIFLITPLQRDNDGYDIYHTNTAGHKLIDYVDIMDKLGELYSAVVYDAYRNSGVNLLTLDEYTDDGLHLNSWGYSKVTPKYAKLIKKNVSFA